MLVSTRTTHARPVGADYLENDGEAATTRYQECQLILILESESMYHLLRDDTACHDTSTTHV